MDARGRIAGWTRDAAADAVEADIQAELESHLELSEEALRAEGRTHDEARSEARARFGDLDRTLRACRRVRLGGRHMLVRIQWVLIALLALSTATMTLYGRQSARAARLQAEYAMVQAHERQMILEQSREREPIEEIIVGVGDELNVRCDAVPELNQPSVVQRDGHALFREVGWIDVAGKSRQQVESILRVAYHRLYEDLGSVYVIVEPSH
jgi:hypothetical protein